MGWSGTAYLTVDVLVKAPTVGVDPRMPSYWIATSVLKNGDIYSQTIIEHPTQLDSGPLVTNPFPNLGIAEYTGWRPLAFYITDVVDALFNIKQEISIYNAMGSPGNALFLMDNVRWYQYQNELPPDAIVISPVS
jgi:hypothetical protein